MDTDPTPFTGNGVHLEFCVNGLELTQLPALTALAAKILIDQGCTAALEIMTGLNRGFDNKVKIGGVHIRIAKNFIFGQCCKCTHDAGLSCSAFSTDDNQFFHFQYFRFVCLI